MNAGGNKVIRYGMTRDTVLGIITRLVFRLRSSSRSHNVALLACENFDDVIAILDIANSTLPDTLAAFEVMWNSFYELAVQPRGRLDAPLEPVIGSAHNFDVSLRSADIGEYVGHVDTAIHEISPAARVIAFGHLGDNNVHVSVQDIDWNDESARRVEDAVYGCLQPFAGAISAEHGIGIEKRAYLPISRSDTEIELMATLKRTLDPDNILNPGKVVDTAAE